MYIHRYYWIFMTCKRPPFPPSEIIFFSKSRPLFHYNSQGWRQWNEDHSDLHSLIGRGVRFVLIDPRKWSNSPSEFAGNLEFFCIKTSFQLWPEFPVVLTYTGPLNLKGFWMADSIPLHKKPFDTCPTNKNLWNILEANSFCSFVLGLLVIYHFNCTSNNCEEQRNHILIHVRIP